MAEGWPYSYTIPAAYQGADPADLTERIIDKLADAGFVTAGESRPAIALGRLADDGTRPLYVNTTADPRALFASFAVSDTSKLTTAQRAIALRMQAYLDNPAPTQPQTVAITKDLIRVVKGFWHVR